MVATMYDIERPANERHERVLAALFECWGDYLEAAELIDEKPSAVKRIGHDYGFRYGRGGSENTIPPRPSWAVPRRSSVPLTPEQDQALDQDQEGVAWLATQFLKWSQPPGESAPESPLADSGREEGDDVPVDDVVLPVVDKLNVHAKHRRPEILDLEEATKLFLERARAHMPRLQRRRPRPFEGECCAVVGLTDYHVGKLAWEPEVGESYDMEIAGRILENAALDTVERLRQFKVETAFLPIGSDFFQFDNIAGQTTRGTQVDCDGRYPKVFDFGVRKLTEFVEELRRAGVSVRLFWIPGNHDHLASYHLARELKAWFLHDDQVDVDVTPSVRKYIHWGRNLLGFTHGHKEKRAELPNLMARECKEAWAASKCEAWFTGHLHNRKVYQVAVGDTFTGTEVHVLPALCNKDSYHFEHGFVGAAKAMDSFIYHRDGHFLARVAAVSRES